MRAGARGPRHRSAGLGLALRLISGRLPGLGQRIRNGGRVVGRGAQRPEPQDQGRRIHMHSMHQRRARPLMFMCGPGSLVAFPAAQLISQLAPRAIAGRGAGARKASQPPPGGSTSPKVHCTVTVLLYCRYRRARVPVALRGSGSGWGGCYGVGGDVSLQFAPLQISIVYAYGAGTHSHTVASPRISVFSALAGNTLGRPRPGGCAAANNQQARVNLFFSPFDSPLFFIRYCTDTHT